MKAIKLINTAFNDVFLTGNTVGLSDNNSLNTLKRFERDTVVAGANALDSARSKPALKKCGKYSIPERMLRSVDSSRQSVIKKRHT